ncbi:MAG: hypothetical protein OEY51_09970, partial [Cyclobacteriaceae bacterium]|nr:hypothetical protein [Cyclobacteriaceae bacterium]
MEEKEYLKDLTEIRSIMERSSRFISLSGLSGIMAGIYALAGACVAYNIIYQSPYILYDSIRTMDLSPGVVLLFADALAVIFLTIVTGIYLTAKKAKKEGLTVWDKSAQRLMINLFIPLATGGAFILIIYLRGYYSIISSLLLIFYGLSLINASKYTLSDIRYLGISEIILGLVAAILP